MGNLHSHIAFILHGTKPIRFEELSSRATELELFLSANPHAFASLIPTPKMKKDEAKKGETSKNVATVTTQKTHKGKKVVEASTTPVKKKETEEKIIVLRDAEEEKKKAITPQARRGHSRVIEKVGRGRICPETPCAGNS